MTLRKGSNVWVEDKSSAWVAAQVTDFIGKQVQVVTENAKKVLTLPEKLYPRDEEADHGGVDDMTKLTYLNEPGVLDNLQRRYALNEIYTYTGSILIAVNPFTKLPHLYNVHMMEQYKGAPFGELSPHVFAVADASYRAMMSENQSQSILVSGESGAGKTETTKLIMQYLTYVGGRAAADDRTVEQQVLEGLSKLQCLWEICKIGSMGRREEIVCNHSGEEYKSSWGDIADKILRFFGNPSINGPFRPASPLKRSYDAAKIEEWLKAGGIDTHSPDV